MSRTLKRVRSEARREVSTTSEEQNLEVVLAKLQVAQLNKIELIPSEETQRRSRSNSSTSSVSPRSSSTSNISESYPSTQKVTQTRGIALQWKAFGQGGGIEVLDGDNENAAAETVEQMSRLQSETIDNFLDSPLPTQNTHTSETTSSTANTPEFLQEVNMPNTEMMNEIKAVNKLSKTLYRRMDQFGPEHVMQQR